MISDANGRPEMCEHQQASAMMSQLYIQMYGQLVIEVAKERIKQRAGMEDSALGIAQQADEIADAAVRVAGARLGIIKPSE